MILVTKRLRVEDWDSWVGKQTRVTSTSLDGIDRRVVDAYFETDNLSASGCLTGRVAKAAREQLGDVQA